MTLLLVIDDKATLMLVKNQLKDICEVGTIVESNSAEEALFLIMDAKPHFVISSDKLPQRSGFELARIINKNKLNIPVIIISSDASMAVEAIRNRVFDFLVLPFPIEKLINSVRKLLSEVQRQDNNPPTSPNNSMVRIATNNGFRLIELDKITHCQADGAYTKLFFSNGTIEYCSAYLGKVEKLLKASNFVRINRGTIVDLDRIKFIDKKQRCCIIETCHEDNQLRISRANMKLLIDSNII
jgi:DNA-binding LytR/AlgR family response regulator